jgi:hypothetical protein
MMTHEELHEFGLFWGSMFRLYKELGVLDMRPEI